MKKRRWFFLLAMLCILSIVINGCQQPAEQEQPKDNGQVEEQKNQNGQKETNQDKNQEEENKDQSEGKFPDGTHKAELDFDQQGWKSTIEITVKDSKITEVDYEEVNKEGDEKTDDKEYAKNMKEASGVEPEEAFKKLEESLISTQDIDKVETVSGATGSSESFKEVAKKALNK